MKELRDRIIRRIVAQHPVTYEKLEELVLSNGYTEIQFMEAMELVHKDKRVVQRTSGDTIKYQPFIARQAQDVFARNWEYPHPGRNGIPEFVMPFPEWDLSWIFLTPEELDKYKAEARGRTYIPNKRWEKKKTQYNLK